METEVVLRSPELPSKYDIIPIHGSDVASFKRCRRYWDWSSPTRTNLRHKVEIYGVNVPLWFGSGIHYALEMYYHPGLKRDPVEAFKTWYTYQWEGGDVTEDWLERSYDVHAQYLGEWASDTDPKKNVVHGLYRIRGLRELLPDPVPEEFEQHLELGIGMLTYYKEYSEKNDEFVVVAAESQYSIPLGFERIDRREESPNYGKRIEVHARGKRDAVIYFPEYDKYGIIDHKTAIKIGDDYALKLTKDEQCSNYLWATIQEAALFDLPWNGKTVDRVIYNALRKNYPKPPTPLKNGFPSMDRQKEGTTAEYFAEYIRKNGLAEWYNDDERAQAYYNHLLTQGDTLYIQRDLVTRNKYEVEATGAHLRMIAEEMLADDLRVYPNPTGEFLCLRCQFRSPCIAKDDGSDWMGMLSEAYEESKGR